MQVCSSTCIVSTKAKNKHVQLMERYNIDVKALAKTKGPKLDKLTGVLPREVHNIFRCKNAAARSITSLFLQFFRSEVQHNSTSPRARGARPQQFSSKLAHAAQIGLISTAPCTFSQRLVEWRCNALRD